MPDIFTLDENDNLWPEDFLPDNSGNDTVLALGGNDTAPEFERAIDITKLRK